MTGNNKFWRASLAGLASVAMLATMGVTALSASAAPADSVTVKVNGTDVPVVVGDSLIDALKGVLPTTAEQKDGKYFVGWYQDGKLVDFTKPVTSGGVVKAEYRKAEDVVKVTFADAGLYSFLPSFDGNGTFYVPTGTTLAGYLPGDKASDGQVVDKWDVTVPANPDDNKTPLAGADAKALSEYNVGTPEDGTGSRAVVVKAANKRTDVKTVRFNGGSAVAPDAYPLNAYADGVNGTSAEGDDLFVDVVDGESTKAPEIISTVYDKSYDGWKQNDTAGQVAVGADVKANSDARKNTYEIDPDAKATYAKVIFDANGGTPDQTQRVKLDKVSYGTPYATIEEPSKAPTRDGYVFKGWKFASGNVNLQGEGTDADGNYTVIKDFSQILIKGNAKFEAVWASTTATLKVTFKDAKYDGSQKDATVEASGNAYLTADQVPAWTRDGYVLSGWTKTGETKVYSLKDLTDNYLVSELNDGRDVTFTAVWTKVTINTVQAALAYINAENPAAIEYDATGKVSATVEDLFTADSWKAFKDTYTTVRKAYDQAVFGAAKDQISDADATKFVSELAAAWQKLEFVHEGNALDKNDRSFAFRLYSSKLDEHFYSQDQSEIYGPALTGMGYKVEAPLFQTVPKAVAGSAEEGAYANLADFSKTTVYEDSKHNFYPIDDDSQKALAAVADPVLTTVVRFYNRETGDHVWSTDPAEQKTLSADKAWNNEGAAFYVPSYTGKTPVTRLYNPATNRHLLSVDPAEQSNLTKNAGWTVDGVVFNGI